MNSRANNLLHTGYWQHANAPYDDVSLDMNNVSSTSLVLGSTSGVVGPMGLFGFQDIAYVPPFALARATSQPPMARHTNVPRDAQTRPRLTSQSPMAAGPILMGQEQNKGLDKLRREVYKPGVQQLNLYYRDHNSRAKFLEKRNNEDDKRCVVCLDDFEPREMVTLTPCHHMFHDNCIVPWVKSHGQCPVCRFVISDRTEEREGTPTSNNSELGNDPFVRELISFIRARG